MTDFSLAIIAGPFKQSTNKRLVDRIYHPEIIHWSRF